MKSLLVLNAVALVELSRIGAWVFPYPAAPRPTLLWIAGYYLALAAVTVWVKRRLPAVAEVAARHSEVSMHRLNGQGEK